MATQVYLPKDMPAGVPWCGPFCIANAMVLYGIPTTPEECAGACKASDDKGSDQYELAKGLRKFGFRANLKDVRSQDKFNATYRWLRKQTDAGKFVVCGINGNYEGGHWVLILQVKGKRILVWDPEDVNPKTVTRKNLYRAWWNVTSPEHPTDTPNQVLLVAMSPRGKIARRAVEVRRNLINPAKGKLPTDKEIPK